MDGNGTMRAADEDRERVVTELREQVAVGRLTLEEFEERLGVAYQAKTWGELRELTHDLPVRIAFDGERPTPKPARTPAPLPGGAQPVRPHPRFHPWVLFPLIGLAVVVTHGAFAPLIPLVLITLVLTRRAVGGTRR